MRHEDHLIGVIGNSLPSPENIVVMLVLTVGGICISIILVGLLEVIGREWKDKARTLRGRKLNKQCREVLSKAGYVEWEEPSSGVCYFGLPGAPDPRRFYKRVYILYRDSWRYWDDNNEFIDGRTAEGLRDHLGLLNADYLNLFY